MNQVRAWVRQGRTDAWIAHQLDVPATELKEFRRRHGLEADGEEPSELDLRDEIEAEIEAATLEEAEAEEAKAAEEAARAEEADADAEGADEPEDGDEPESDGDDPEQPKRRRRRRRGGRGKRTGVGLQASFDHGEADGYGLWLDPSVAEDPIYSEHWAGKRHVEVTIDPDRIVITRVEEN